MIFSRTCAFWLLLATHAGCEGARSMGANDKAARKIRRMTTIDAHTQETFNIQWLERLPSVPRSAMGTISWQVITASANRNKRRNRSSLERSIRMSGYL